MHLKVLHCILIRAHLKFDNLRWYLGLTLWEAHSYLMLNLDLNCVSGESYTAALLYCFTNTGSQYTPSKQVHMWTKRQNAIMITQFTNLSSPSALAHYQSGIKDTQLERQILKTKYKVKEELHKINKCNFFKALHQGGYNFTIEHQFVTQEHQKHKIWNSHLE